jgi:hypothetical protein
MVVALYGDDHSVSTENQIFVVYICPLNFGDFELSSSYCWIPLMLVEGTPVPGGKDKPKFEPYIEKCCDLLLTCADGTARTRMLALLYIASTALLLRVLPLLGLLYTTIYYY